MFADIVFDLILTAMLAAGIILGIKNGFISTIAKPIKFAAAVAIAIGLASVIGMGIIEPIIGPAISNKLSDTLIEKYADITAETANESLPTLIKLAAGLCGIDISSITSSNDGAEIIHAVVDAVTDPVVEIVATIAGFVLVFFVAKILLEVAMYFVEGMFKKGVAATTNKVLGAVFTFLLAFIAAWAFTAVTDFFLNIPLIAKADWVENFDGGLLYRFFKSFSPIDLLLSF